MTKASRPAAKTAPQPAAKPVKGARPITMTVEEAVRLSQGLAALDGYDRTIEGPDGERTVREFYKFEPLVGLAVARNANSLEPVARAYQDARNRLIRKHAGGGFKVDPGTQEAVAFAEDDRKILAAEETVALVPIREADLKLDVNPIPPSVLGLLLPLLDD
jgi:hypothetical protein